MQGPSFRQGEPKRTSPKPYRDKSISLTSRKKQLKAYYQKDHYHQYHNIPSNTTRERIKKYPKTTSKMLPKYKIRSL